MISYQLQRGFTLVELVVVMVITGILSVVVVQFITTPIEMYVDQSRRAALVDEAQVAMRRMMNEVQLALPNSIRVGCGGACFEIMRSVAGGKYRSEPFGDVLSFSPSFADTSFEALGTLNLPSNLTYSTNVDDCVQSNAACLAIYNTGFTGLNAWNADNIATISGIAGTPSIVSFLPTGFSGGQTAFPAASPSSRFYIVDTPLKFICDTSSNTLRRYQHYTIVSDETQVDTHTELINLANPAEYALLAKNISQCQFTYSAGTPTRNSLLTIRLALSDSSESITLHEQVHIKNLP